MQESGHPSRSELAELAAGSLPRIRRRQLVRHLEACPPCRGDLLLLAGEAPPAGRILRWQSRRPGPAYSQAIDRALDGLQELFSRLRAEVAAQPAAYREPAHPAPSRWRTDEGGDHRQGPLAVCNLLLEGSLKAMANRPGTARELAERAIELADQNLPGSPWDALLRDLQARGWAYLGYLHGRRHEPAAAEAAFGRAAACLLEGTGDPLDEACVLQLEALWTESRGELDDAEWLLDREAALYGQSGHPRLMGRALVHKASLRARAGDLSEAIRLCRESLDLLDPEADAKLLATARRDLANHLQAAGRLPAARALLAELAGGGSPCGGWASAELQRLEGKLALSDGRLTAAAEAFEQARRGFLAQDQLGEATRATLDLAAVLCRRGSFEPGRLAALITPLLDGCGLPPDTRAVLERLQQAVTDQDLTAELVDRLAGEVDEEERPEAYLALIG